MVLRPENMSRDVIASLRAHGILFVSTPDHRGYIGSHPSKAANGPDSQPTSPSG